MHVIGSSLFSDNFFTGYSVFDKVITYIHLI